MKAQLILGPPGTGKTTALLDIVDAALAEGVPPERIAFLTFTKNAATEAIDRACARFPVDREGFTYFRTLHSLAYWLLGMRRTEVMADPEWRAFGREHGYEFRLRLFEEELSTPHELADQLARCYQLARARCISPEEEWRRSGYPFPEWAITRFVTQLADYKRTNDLRDFADFMVELDAKIPVDILIVDEAQDLTPQQWVMVEKLSRNVSQLYIAGDDDQAIFEWAGADVKRFLQLPYPSRVLPKSYRLPRRVKAFADRIIQPVGLRFPKPYASREEEGVMDYRNLGGLEVGDGSWLLLGRTNRHLGALAALAKASGRVYHHNGRWSHDTDAARAILGWSRLAQGRHIDIKLFKAVSRFAAVSWHGPVPEHGVNAVALNMVEKIAAPWWEGLSLSLEEVAYYRAVLRRGEKLDRPGNVRVATVHRVKGQEADHVVLLAEPVRREPGADAERRVWYVGATRARHSLTVVGAERNPVMRF